MEIKQIVSNFFEYVKEKEIDIYNEFSFQHELGVFFRNQITETNYKIEFERNISFFQIQKSDCIKKEIDIVIYNLDRSEKIAIELKYPQNGQYPEQMFSITKDVKFGEQLIKNGFDRFYSITLTDDHIFYLDKGKKDGIYKIFRHEKKLYGHVIKPTGKKDELIDLVGEYDIVWKNWKDNFKYMVIEILGEKI